MPLSRICNFGTANGVTDSVTFRVVALCALIAWVPVSAPGSSQTDSVLSVTEARLDANGDYIPDRLGQRITVAGRANVYSGVLHSSRLSICLQDTQSGIELYNIDPGEPISEGDSVVATGTLEMYEGMTRVTRATYKVYRVDRPMARELHLRVKDAPSEKYEGMLVRVTGEVTTSWSDPYGAYLTLREHADDSDSLVVFLSFRHKPGIDFSSISPGEHISVTGVLGQYVRGGALNSGYEIYPRYPEDIRIRASNARSYLVALLISGGLVVLALIWVLAMRRQVARRTRQLQESEQRFRNHLEDIQLLAVNLDAHARIVFVNTYLLNLTGWSRDEVIDRVWQEVFIPSHEGADTQQKYEEALRTGTMPLRFEAEIITRKGEIRVIAWTVTISHDSEGKVSGTASIGEDITERKLTEERLATSLLEKEVLLKEVYHRVKNNLQTVSSVLSLQAASIKDPAVRDMFLENEHRVRSMALIHEKLYRSKTLAHIDFHEYLDGLATSLFRSYRVAGDVALRVDVKDVTLDIDTSITCGLLVNELLSNALKHAFPGGKSGEIAIVMHPVDGGNYALAFADDGVGLPSGFQIEKSKTLGMSLVNNLVHQLDGKMEIMAGPGTRYVITFPSS
jgi:PAS domain S-box-containing protein